MRSRAFLVATAAPSRPNALGQMDDDATSYRFPVCVLDGVSATDVDLYVADPRVYPHEQSNSADRSV
jgi:hypothetical protein